MGSFEKPVLQILKLAFAQNYFEITYQFAIKWWAVNYKYNESNKNLWVCVHVYKTHTQI